jgi:hypothetical protein
MNGIDGIYGGCLGCNGMTWEVSGGCGRLAQIVTE